MKFPAFDTQRSVREEQFRLVVASVPTGTAAQTATGCPEGTFRCTVLKNGTGDYTINFNNTFVRTPGVWAEALHASSKLFTVLKTRTTSAVNILVYSDAGTATDATEVDVFVRGHDTDDQVG